MLRLMRQNASSWIIKFLLGIIVLVFIFMGVGSYDSHKKDSVASVNGKSISVAEYQEAYNSIIERMRQQFGQNLSEEMLKMFKVKEQAIDRLIDNKLLLSEADKLHLSVSDAELAQSIKGLKAFQVNSIFNADQYKTVLRYNGLTPERFEAKQREALLLDKLRALIIDSVKVSENEAKAWFNWNDTSVEINYVHFQPKNYPDVNPTEDQIKSYFEEHKDQYKTKQKRKVRYLKFSSKDYLAKVSVTEAEIKEYYDTHPKEFFSPKTVEARHILKKVDQNADPQLVEQKKQEILDILKQAKAGNDFAELAKKYSEGPSKASGGQLGAFKKDTMVKPFADKAFSMKVGEISDPVRTQFGWHLIKVEKINAATTQTLEEARADIQKKLAQDKSKTLAYNEAVEIYDSSFEGDDLVLAAKERQLTVHTTDYFTNSGTVNGIENGRKFVKTAFSLSLMEISDILDLGNEYYLIQVIEKKAPVLPPYETVKDAVKSDLMVKMRDEKASQVANDFFTALKDSKDMASAAKNKELKMLSTDFFKRDDNISNIGNAPEIAKAAFRLTSDQKIGPKVYQTRNGYYVIALKDRKKPDSGQFEKDKNNIIKKLIQEKQSSTYRNWLALLKQGSEIKIEKGIIQ